MTDVGDVLLEIVRGMRTDIASLRDQVGETGEVLAGEIQRAEASREQTHKQFDALGSKVDCLAKQVTGLSLTRRDRRKLWHVFCRVTAISASVIVFFFAVWTFWRDLAQALMLIE